MNDEAKMKSVSKEDEKAKGVDLNEESETSYHQIQRGQETDLGERGSEAPRGTSEMNEQAFSPEDDEE